MLSIAPDSTIVDLTHSIPPQDVRAGAFQLMIAVPYFPRGTVFVAVVDPGVGTARPAIAVSAAGYRFVGPDNGLLSWAVRRLNSEAAWAIDSGGEFLAFTQPDPRDTDLADPTDTSSQTPIAVALAESRFWLPAVSATFHGRDVFGPVAAHIARGTPLHELGRAVEAIRALPFPIPARDGDMVRGEIIHVDRFGNLISNLGAADIGPNPTIAIGDRQIVGLTPHFQQSAPVIALVGSSGFLEIAVPNGNAAALLGLGVGSPLTVTRSSVP
jgi:hypothetical protein